MDPLNQISEILDLIEAYLLAFTPRERAAHKLKIAYNNFYNKQTTQ